MKEQSDMEILYEQYLLDNSRFYEKDGITYYKIVDKKKIKVRGGMVLVTVPREAVRSIDDYYCDETENIFLIETPIHMSFGANPIPQWYIETVTLPIKDISDISQIGDYLGVKCIAE